jgi:hypothetical protein
MAPRQFVTLMVCSLTLFLATSSKARSEEPQGGYQICPIGCPLTGFAFPGMSTPYRILIPTVTANKSDSVCKVYSLKDMAQDPSFGDWVAQTIPQVIQPGTWNQSPQANQKRVLSYYAPGKVLVVYHTPTVQTEVEAFLKNVRQAMPATGTQVSTPAPGVLQAQFATPNMVPAAMNQTPTSYPIPATTERPKHLFHFIIRYEGEGIIDSNVVEFTKAMSGGACTQDRWTGPVTGSSGPLTQPLYSAPACYPSVPGAPAGPNCPQTSPQPSGYIPTPPSSQPGSLPSNTPPLVPPSTPSRGNPTSQLPLSAFAY